jgi:MFS family permease
MIRAGSLGAVVAIIYVMAMSLIYPACSLCLAPLLGIGTGYLAGWFGQSQRAESGLIAGIVAGALTGLGAMTGQILGALVNAVLVTNFEALPVLMEDLGFPQLATIDSTEYWQTLIFLNSFCGVLNLAIIIGGAVFGNMLWVRHHKVKSPSTLT